MATIEPRIALNALPGPQARIGRLIYRFFETFFYDFAPDEAFFRPAPDAGHTCRSIEIPLGPVVMPGMWLEPEGWTGAAVLMVHGAGTEAPAPYMFFMRALIERGIAVMTIEMDGHGQNPRPFAPEGVGENVPAALRVLFDMPGLDEQRVGILGVSLGAACALHAAARRDDIRSLALVSLPLRVAESWRMRVGEVLGILSPHCAPIALEISPKRLFGFLLRPVRVAIAGGEAIARHILEPAFPQAIDGALVTLDPLGQLERLGQVPLLVLTGSWDTIAHVGHARTLAMAAGERAQLAIARGRNHFTIMTSRFAARTLANWFESRLAPHPVTTQEVSR